MGSKDASDSTSSAAIRYLIPSAVPEFVSVPELVAVPEHVAVPELVEGTV